MPEVSPFNDACLFSELLDSIRACLGVGILQGKLSSFITKSLSRNARERERGIDVAL